MLKEKKLKVKQLFLDNKNFMIYYNYKREDL